MAEYEIRPHHAFKGWFIVWRDGLSLSAFSSRVEAEAYVMRHKCIQDLKRREIKL